MMTADIALEQAAGGGSTDFQSLPGTAQAGNGLAKPAAENRSVCRRSLLDINALNARLDAGGDWIAPIREALAAAQARLDQHYLANHRIDEIVAARAWVVDQVLISVCERQQWPDDSQLSLLAVGGYGRGELLPHSDVDLLILTRKSNQSAYREAIARLTALLWDIGLDLGLGVRSIRQCKTAARGDITIATTLMESRTLAGPEALRQKMLHATGPRSIWPAKQFLRAKSDEQIARHEKHDDVDYALEPNIKNSPGGLRDIQTIAWVARRHFGAESFGDMKELGFLTRAEHIMLTRGRNFLWKLRYGLHMLAGRREDRLLFDQQRALAELFDYRDDKESLGVEKLMKQYYRAVANLRALNDMLLQHLDEAISSGGRDRISELNRRFRVRNGYLEARSDRVFRATPSALLEVFVLLANNPQIRGIRASTIRLLRENRKLIDNAFRGDIRNISMFMELLHSPHQMVAQLRRMARYGILGRYLPEFGKIMGQMQHDLFHIYTVDAHTLQVLQNMRRLARTEAAEEFPVAARIYKNLPKVVLLYIAGLYHDIAKGRGGDHSTLGMVDAENFCRRHRLSAWDGKLVAWLVENHLLMSMTAQRKDIEDPEVIHEFAKAVGDKLHLDYLYALTVTDIRATNPSLWNSWRATLLRNLYLDTKRALRLGLENPRDRGERIADKKQSAQARLRADGIDEDRIAAVWAKLNEEYFLRESVDNLCWHTRVILRSGDDQPVVSLRELSDGAEHGATLVFTYTRDTDYLFVNSTVAFERLRLNVQSARIFTSASGMCANTYAVLEADGNPVGRDSRRVNEIRSVVRKHLDHRVGRTQSPAFRRGRRLASFGQRVNATLINTPGKNYSTLEIDCPDQSGILARVGQVFADLDIKLIDARITTLGERVEDLFFITGGDGRPLHDADLAKALQRRIKSAIAENLAVR